MDGFLKEALEAAKKAGKMLRENIDSSSEIFFKGPVDLVTDLDNRSQRMIFDHLASCFPGHDFMGEEGLSEDRGAEFRWVIDPIDGTTNYVHGFPIFSISIALEVEGEIRLGLVYDPMREEMFSAIKGQGAILGGKNIHVSSIDDLDKSLVATGFPYDLRESEVNNMDHFNNFLFRVQAIRRCGSAAMDLCYVACGRFDGFWELKLNPWDMAAGALIVREAGGRISDFEDGEFNIFSSEILATNGLIHDQMLEVLQLARRREE